MSKINTNKRQRSENWVEEDKIILKDLVKERVRAIENKNTDTNSNALKVVAWNELKESFNCMCKGAPRTVTQLKAQWGIIKINEKKRKAEQRREILKTGGGPPPVTEISAEEDLTSWLPNEFVIDSNEFDSDNLNQHMLHPSTSSKLNDMISINVDNAEAPLPPKPSSSTVLDPPSPNSLDSKPKKIKKKCFSTTSQVGSPAEQIAACEMECRRELHKIQIQNEKIKTDNLKLEAELLRTKIEYYKKKMGN